MTRCDTYSFGNCTWGACEAAGWIPEGLGDAGDWAANAAARGWQVTEIPTVGAAVSYCRGDGYSQWGHCGIVLEVGGDGRFLVHEMNYSAFDAYDDRWSTLGDVCGFILAPGTSPGQPPPGQGGPPGGVPPQIPGPLMLAYENVRAYTTTTADQLAGMFIQAQQLAGLAGS